ncbi:transposase family protein [Streptomyces erythrochromogenes]|uniref:transposase family protein n=1 Tax=Streptomyces erythrochromogenes TaxID=285574 RepID=UPI003681BE7F
MSTPKDPASVLALVHLREHTTCAKLAADFGISEGTAHAYVHSVIALLAERAPSPTRALRLARPDHVPVDGIIVECDRVGGREQDYFGKAGRHGVNIQAVAGPAGELIRYSPALPGRTVDITAPRTHGIITFCERLRIPALGDKACNGAGETVQMPFKRHLGRPLTTRQAAVNRAHSRIRSPCRESHRPHQGLAHPPQGPDQPQQPHANRQSHPHPGHSPLKKLTGFPAGTSSVAHGGRGRSAMSGSAGLRRSGWVPSAASWCSHRGPPGWRRGCAG